jgi:hypothetical protein
MRHGFQEEGHDDIAGGHRIGRGAALSGLDLHFPFTGIRTR